MLSKKLICLLLIMVTGLIWDVSSQTILFPDANGNFNIPKSPVIRGSSDSRVQKEQDEAFQSQANSLTKIEDFADFYKVKLPKFRPFIQNVSIAVHSRIGAPGAIPLDMPQAVCTPEMTPVPLDLPYEPGVSFFPTCVRVNRCGGCCLLSHHSCQAVTKETVLVKVIKVKEEITKSRRRRVRNAEPAFITVEVEQDVQCDCNCRLQASECDPAIHVYSENQCECNCKDTAREFACLGSRDHFWSYDTCQCLCRKTLSCSTGQDFDHKTCRCVKRGITFPDDKNTLYSLFDYL